MAITSNTYTGNGSNKLFSITFPYLETTDVDVYLNGTLQTITTQYTFANATTIEFVAAPANGAVVLLDRSTDDSALAATFFPGSSIKAADLNADFDQTLYVVQEINNKAVKLNDPLYANKTYIDAADALKVNKAGDTMSGALAMGTNKITGLGNPTNAQDAATKTYVDAADALKVNKAGDTMSGNLAMGGNKVTGLGTPTANADAVTKSYLDAYINTAYLGPLASDPAVRPSGGALQAGDIYFNTTQNILKAYTGSIWVISAAAGNIVRWRKTASAGNTTLSGVDDLGVTLSYVVGNEQVYLNGALQTRGVDYTAGTGTSITLTPALLAGDVVELHAVQGYVSATITPGSINDALVAPAAGIQYSKLALSNSIVNADVNASAGIVATKLSFTQSGTGATARTVDSKLKDVVSVKDFGAVGDGTTDDRTAFINAFAAAFNVYVPPGTYLCNGSLTTLRSGSKLFGAGSSSIIKWGTAQSDLSIDTKTNVVVEDLVIDGGGQTTNIYTGLAGCNGISIKASSNVKINRVTAQNMGIVNQANPAGTAPAYDVSFSGYGFNVSARTGAVSNIRITNCTAKNIAGAGYQKGDGFYVEGYRSGVTTEYMDVIIENCYSSTCGRHCYTVAGETPESVPSGIVFNNCYGEKSALDGCDIESGYKVILDNCIWKNCGNDQTYYNPVSVFGATYRLLAAIALDNYCQDIVINNNSFENCYYGFTYGGSNSVTISNSIFKNSTTSDINQGLATGIIGFKLVNCHFLSTTGALYYYSTGQSGFVASGCTFAGQVIFSSMIEGTFTGCTFKKGININGGSSGFSRSKIVDSTFTDFAGDAITMLSAANHQHCIIKGNVFYGTGNLANGINFPYQAALGWIISDNKFIGLTGSGIRILNGDARHYADICGNNFESCGYGIYISQSIKQSLIANNTFGSIADWCIIINNIFSSGPMPNGPSIMNNLTRESCVNGIGVFVSTGTYDRTMLVGNNVSSCSGTKWSLSGGNANGVVANNITT